MATETKTDQALLADFLRDADDPAFEEIVRRHGAMVYRVCLRVLADHHEAEDAAQAVFAVLAKKADSIRKRRSLGSWLHGVARTTALCVLRRQIRRRKREEEVAMCSPDLQPTEEEWQERVLALLDEGVAGLSEQQREAVVLRYLAGKPIAEAAVLAGCTPEALTSRTRHGLARLRGFFTKRNLTVTGTVLAALLEAEAQAAIPETLLPSILTASRSVALGGGTGAVGGSASSLAKEVMTMMVVTKLRSLAALVAVSVLALLGAWTMVAAVTEDDQDRVAELPAGQEPPKPAVQTGDDRGDVSVPADQQWITLCDFDFNAPTDVRLIKTDPGLTWSVVDGEGRLKGSPTDPRWLDDGVELLLRGDRRTKIEIAYDFRIHKCEGYHLINLSATADEYSAFLCMFFQGNKGNGHYHIQTDGLKCPSRLVEGAYVTPGFGDETDAFHRMRIVHDRESSRTEYYVDDVRLGVVEMDDDLGPIRLVRMAMETPRRGYDVDIRYDNLTVGVAGAQVYPDESENLRERLIQRVDNYFVENRNTIITPEVIRWCDFDGNANGNVSVRCRYWAILRRRPMICEQVFDFDGGGDLFRVQNTPGFPKPGRPPQTGDE